MIDGEIAALTGALDGGRWARSMGIGLTLTLGVLAFAVWQFRVYWRRYRTGDEDGENALEGITFSAKKGDFIGIRREGGCRSRRSRASSGSVCSRG